MVLGMRFARVKPPLRVGFDASAEDSLSKKEKLERNPNAGVESHKMT